VPSEKRKFGDLGERIAGEWLRQKGFSILETNYLKKWGEIDIVAKGGGVLRFVEVKTVRRDLLLDDKNGEVVKIDRGEYHPEENVHPKKLERLHRTIQSYLSEKHQTTEEWQLDVVAVYIDEPHKLAKMEMTPNIVA
jgi:putative endonuclease